MLLKHVFLYLIFFGLMGQQTQVTACPEVFDGSFENPDTYGIDVRSGKLKGVQLTSEQEALRLNSKIIKTFGGRFVFANPQPDYVAIVFPSRLNAQKAAAAFVKNDTPIDYSHGPNGERYCVWVPLGSVPIPKRR